MKQEPKPTEKYKEYNHHHELNDDYEFVDFGNGKFIANKQSIPLLKALNEAGLKTRTHHITEETNAFVSILLENVEFEVNKVFEKHANRKDYNGKLELLIKWQK